MPHNPFKDVIISLTGRFGFYTHEKLKTRIERLGATFTEKVSANCTHLITTDTEVRNRSSKVIDAYAAYRCQVVSLSWLVACEVAGEPVPEGGHRISRNGVGEPYTAASFAPSTAVKRLREETEGSAEGSAIKKVKLVGVPYSPDLIVPAHPDCPFKYEFSVALDKYGHPWDARLVRSSADGKRNSYYWLQLLLHKSKTRFVCWASWGRIGEGSHQLRCSPCDEDTAREDFQRRFLEKVGFSWFDRFSHEPREGKFTFLAPGYVSRDPNHFPFDVENAKNIYYNIPPPGCSLPESVRSLVALVLNQEKLLCGTPSLKYDELQLPLGRLSREAVIEGYMLIEKISDFIKSPIRASAKYQMPLQDAVKNLSNRYWNLIPHVFGKGRPEKMEEGDIEKETLLLNDLADAIMAHEIISSAKWGYVHPLEQAHRELRLEGIEELKSASNEYVQVSRYFNLKLPNSGYKDCKIVQMFRLRRTWEEDRFRSSPYATPKKSNRRLLWHGSKLTNWAGILREGLRICPGGKSPNGSTLGKGIYFSDSARTSLWYTRVDYSKKNVLLLLCDVELGDHINVVQTVVIHSRPPGTTSTQWVRGPQIRFSQDAGVIRQDLQGAKFPEAREGKSCEYVVYNPAQVRMRYLLQIQK
ncbi:hypothetical protein BDV12DRAFT_199317 [Aspergillus spectabilis]